MKRPTETRDAAGDPSHSPLDDRRQATRFNREPETEFVEIRPPSGQPIQAEVRDESLGGLAVIVAASECLPIGLECQLVYAGDHLDAVVRYALPLQDGRYRLGLQCCADRA